MIKCLAIAAKLLSSTILQPWTQIQEVKFIDWSTGAGTLLLELPIAMIC